MIKDKKDKRIEIRVTDEELKLLKITAFSIGQTPSSMLRMFVDTTINSLKLKVSKGEMNLEDYEAIFNDKL